MIIAGPVSIIMPKIKNITVQTLKTDTELWKLLIMKS